jgi:EmrB/QacA subfamily drug resistance transporter
LSGWIADRYGTRTVFRAAIGIFTVASVFCGLSENLWELVAARIVQGFGGAMMVPVGRLALLRSVDKSQYARAMAYLTTPAFIGPVLGPPVGGFITTFFSWRWVFFLNIPIGLVGMVLVTFLIEDYKEPHSPPLDWVGFLLSGTSLGCIIYSLDLAGRGTGHGLGFLGLLSLGLLIGVAAVFHAIHHPNPLIDLKLFRFPTFAVSIWGGFIFRAGAGSMPFLLPILFQLGLGMTAFAAGLIILADALGNMAMNAFAPAVLRRWGFRRLLIVNGVLSALGIAVCALFGASTPSALIFAVLFVCALSRSMQYNALSTLQYADIPARNMSAASSFASMVQQLCSGGGIAAAAVLLQVALMLRGAAPGALELDDIRIVYVIVGLFTVSSIWFFFRLARDAGAEVSGHGGARTAAPTLSSDD